MQGCAQRGAELPFCLIELLITTQGCSERPSVVFQFNKIDLGIEGSIYLLNNGTLELRLKSMVEAKTQLRVQPDENEGDVEFAGEDDFELYAGGTDHLGRVHPDEPSKIAAANQKIVNIRLLKSSIGASIQELAWGNYHGEAACRILLEFRVRASTRFRIKDADFTCTLVPLDEPNGIKAGESEYPKILSHGPRPPGNEENRERRNHGVQIVTTLDLSPEVEALGVRLKLGSWTKQRTYSPITGYDFHSDPNSDDETILWSVQNRNERDLRLDHDFQCELLVAHGGQDFRAEFEIETRLDFAGTLLTINKKKVVARHQDFRVFPSMVEFEMPPDPASDAEIV